MCVGEDASVPPATSVSRRSVLQGLAAGAAGTALAAAPVRLFDAAAAAAPAADGVFGYGVASGDPTGTSVILWTRATPSPAATPGSGLGTPVAVTWEVARDDAFTLVVRSGTVTTSPDSDHTVKVDVTGLSPYTRYYYRFTASGQTSRIGRTQTAGDDDEHALRLAFVSCSNYTGGYFTGYRAIAARDDLDVVLHLGDYIYEYGEAAEAPDRYGPDALKRVRDGVPAAEILSLQDYRLRHALHKADPDQAAAHQRHPWITIFDDHEVANNTWATGAENHTEGAEGVFLERKARAYQVYLEWMPVRPAPVPDPVAHDGTRFFKRFTFGPLADLSVLETRQNRSEQINAPGSTTKGGGFVPDSTPGLADPTRHLPEPKQMDWVKKNTASKGRPWHLVGNQVVFTPVRFPGAVLGVKGVPLLLNSDQWDGYQADQAALISHFGAQPSATAGDVVLMTGDIHSSWAADIPADRSTYAGANNSVAVEFVCPSITSDGFYEIVSGNNLGDGPSAPRRVATTQVVVGAVRQTNPWVKYLDGVGHGYCVLDVTPDRVQSDYFLTPTPTTSRPDPRIDSAALPVFAAAFQTVRGSRRVTSATGPVGPRSDQPEDASVPSAALPEHVGPAVVVGVLGAAAVAWSRRRAAVAAAEGDPASA